MHEQNTTRKYLIACLFYSSSSCLGRDWDRFDDCCCVLVPCKDGSVPERDRVSGSVWDELRDFTPFLSVNCSSFDDERGNGRGTNRFVVDSFSLSVVVGCNNCGSGFEWASLGMIKYL
jgi:hypothetical protein